jgi:hypothetical protein
MFRAYASAVRAAYLSGIVLAPLFMAENLLQIIRQWALSFTGLLWFLLFTALLCLPSVRAWVRLRRGAALIPTAWIRTHWLVAAISAGLCVLAALSVAAYAYAKWIFVAPLPEGPEIAPFVTTLILYSIVLPGTEILMAARVRSVPIC